VGWKIHQHRCPKCKRRYRCEQRPSTHCTDGVERYCERCPAPRPIDDRCTYVEPGSVPQAGGTRCSNPSVMSGIFRVRRSVIRNGSRVESQGYEEMGRCALHAPESWKKEQPDQAEAPAGEIGL